MMKRTIEMNFVKADGKRYTLRLENAREDVTGAEIDALMDSLVQKDVFVFDGAAIEGKVAAKIVAIDETPVALS